MSRPIVQFNDYISLAVMLLMVVALVAGQADASAEKASVEPVAISPIAIVDDQVVFNFDGHIGDQAMKVSIAVAADLSHFRGEDE